MNCPPEVEQSVLRILRMGILQGRVAGWEGDAERCAIECDHLHNLPGLLENFSIEALQYYFQVERSCYLEKCPHGAQAFGVEWESLAEFLTIGPCNARSWHFRYANGVESLSPG